MNYVKETNSFYDWLETNSVSDSAINLWHALMHINNKASNNAEWINEFTVAISTLMCKTSLSKSSIIRARNLLKQLGRIDFRERKGNQSAIYTVIAFHRDTQTVTQSVTQAVTQSDTINKLNKTKLNSIGNKLPICEEEPHEVTEHINYKQLVSFFNEKTNGLFGTIRYPLSNQRKKMINARIREYGKDAFQDAIIKSSQSSYLKTVSWFSFDWMIKPTNFEKLISGNYDAKNRETNNTGSEFAIEDQVAEGLARGLYEKQQRGI